MTAGTTTVLADAHAIIITKSLACSPSGAGITNSPVDSIDKLFKLLEYKTLTPAVMPPQVWIADDEACAALGWDVDPGDEEDYEADDNGELTAAGRAELKADVLARLDAATHRLLGPKLSSPDGALGWHLFLPGRKGELDPIGHHIRLTRIGQTGRRYKVDLILAPWMWTMPRVHNIDRDQIGLLGSEREGTLIDTADADAPRRIAERIIWHVQNFGVLPSDTGARTGGSIADRVYRERRDRGKGIVVTEAVKMPPIQIADHTDLEPPVLFGRPMESALESPDADRVVEIDQRAAYLASAGMIDLGYGGLSELTGGDAEDAAGEDKIPFGTWHVTLPAANGLTLPPLMPLPHPRMRRDQDVTTWVTTEGLRTLLAPVADGGAGLDVGDLGIDDAWVTPQQGNILRRWKELLAAPRKAAEETRDRAAKSMVREIYSGYIGRMSNPDLWSENSPHHQPLWRASIIAHARNRSRVKAAEIAAAHGIWPLVGVTDAWTYLCPAGVDLSDSLDYLGKFVVKNEAPFTDELMLEMVGVTEPAQMRRTIAAAFAAAKGG